MAGGFGPLHQSIVRRIFMDLYRCQSCGLVLVRADKKTCKRHAGHKFVTTNNVKVSEMPKYFYWRLREWLKK